jgi:GT2 family glycosyltransferase
MDLSIIILNYNAKDYVKKCIESVLSSDLKNIKNEIIVIDNNSTDGSKDDLSKLQKKLKFQLILNKDNSGFSKGNNIGAKKSQGKYILFLNPDTFVSKNSLKEIYSFMEDNPEVGVSCPRLDLPDGTLTSASHRGFPTPWNALSHFSGLSTLFPTSKYFSGYTKGWLLEDKKPHEVDAISGGFFFVRRKAAEEVGWWDEDYFMYGEDIDFCYMLKQKGWKVMFLPQISVLHYHGVSSGIKTHSKEISTADRETRLRAAKASSEAMKIFYSKHYKDKYPKMLNWMVLAGISALQSYRLAKHARRIG